MRWIAWTFRRLRQDGTMPNLNSNHTSSRSLQPFSGGKLSGPVSEASVSWHNLCTQISETLRQPAWRADVKRHSIHCLDSCLFTFTDFRGSFCMPSLLGTDCANLKKIQTPKVYLPNYSMYIYGFKKASSATKLQCLGQVFLQNSWGNLEGTQQLHNTPTHNTAIWQTAASIYFSSHVWPITPYMMQVVRIIKISRARQSSGRFPMAQLQLWTCSLLSTSFCFSDLWQSSCWQNKKVISNFFGSPWKSRLPLDSKPKNHLYKTSCHFCPKW